MSMTDEIKFKVPDSEWGEITGFSLCSVEKPGYNPCPLCGAETKLELLDVDIDETYTAVSCKGCGMNFSYTQRFSHSKKACVAVNESFLEVWNRRAVAVSVASKATGTSRSAPIAEQEWRRSMADKERLVEIVLGMVEDVNPAEIASHIARGNLHEWCRQWRETVGKYLADVGNSVTVHKTGHWKHRKSWDKYVCSECGYEHDEPHNYCLNPKCNAKMEGK